MLMKREILRGYFKMKILDGKVVAHHWKKKLQQQLLQWKDKGITPTLAIILAGEDKPSVMYTHFMKKVAIEYGFNLNVYKEENITEKQLITLIHTLNETKEITGILMMMPLPKSIDAQKVIQHINPDKDIDGLTTVNLGRLLNKEVGHIPCTPRAVMAILSFYDIELTGKNVVVLGRSTVVGKPISILLEEKNATVTVCHSHTKNLPEITCQADILVSAIGKPHLVNRDMVKPGAIVIDVGINQLRGKTVGDVDFEDVSSVVSAITPVPGGVGSVTTTMVVDGIVKAIAMQTT
jgi:5,10-methylene-tetrahydrofolate dehydrogenase/Methenyl tetrahydrofolate cyclohydrolase